MGDGRGPPPGAPTGFPFAAQRSAQHPAAPLIVRAHTYARSLEVGPTRTSVSSAELFFHRHIRSCAASPAGCSGGGGGKGSGSLTSAPSGLLPVAPAWLDCGLGLCWLGVTRAAKLVALAGLWLASVPSLWAAPFLTALTGGAVPLLEASAALSGYPVPVMAAQAIWLGNGWRSVAGASALIAWGVGWHSPCGRGSCQALGLVAVAAGSSSASWGAYLACEAALRFPTFPGPELLSASSSGDGLGPQGVAVAAGLAPNALPAANAASVPPPPAPSPDTRRARTSRVNGATWFVDVKPTAMASSCCAATCNKNDH